jgi:hypothetical protein
MTSNSLKCSFFDLLQRALREKGGRAFSCMCSSGWVLVL